MDVRDSNAAKLHSKTKGAPAPTGQNGQIQVDHGNAPLLMVKFLELIHKELKDLNHKFEHIGRAVDAGPKR